MIESIDTFPIRHIVVPYDDSWYSEHAIEFATVLAKKFNSHITLLTVFYSDILGRSFLDMKKHQTLIERRRLQKLNEKFRSFEDSATKLNISIKSNILVSSSVAQSILSFATSKMADLIVMGTRGKGSTPQYMRLGSVAIDVSQASQCPVVFVK